MTTIRVGDVLVYDDHDDGLRGAVVEEVTSDRVRAITHETGERFDLSRAELEAQGFAANGSVWDLIFTRGGFDLFIEAQSQHCAAARNSRSN